MSRTALTGGKIVFFLLVLAAALGFPLTVQADVTVDGTVYSGEIDRAAAFDVLEEVNRARRNHGLEALTMDLQLMEAAQMRAGELTVMFSHTRPNGSSCMTITDGMDISAAGENIASGGGTVFSDAGSVMNAWMNSDGHRANILNEGYRSIGAACFRYRNSTYGTGYFWVQLFSYETSEGCSGMYRMYNPNSGEHFYTASAAEKYSLELAGWTSEGIGWIAPKNSSAAVYRLYNANAGDHHYTMDKGERDYLIRLGWKDEGIGWYSDPGKRYPLYRQYNPNASAGSHNYTISKGENDWLVKLGWQAEGIGWYASAGVS